MLKKVVQWIFCFAFTICICISFGMANAAYVPVDCMENSVVMPYADVIVYKTRVYKGVKQYRRWNETKRVWVDTDWIETDSVFIPQDELEAIDPDAEEYESDAEGSIERAAVGSAAFDYSTIDDINKFDLYQEKMQNSHDGISCVPATAKFTNADNELKTDRCRFGAFLRSSDERQRYYIYNAPYDHQLYSNVFTIYADLEVKFEMRDYEGGLVFDETQYNPSKDKEGAYLIRDW